VWQVLRVQMTGEEEVTFEELAALEPGLLTLAADLENGRGF